MRRLFLIILLSILAYGAFAQKKDSVKYEKFAKITLNDIQLLLQLSHEYKRTIIYDPTIEEKNKTQYFRNLEAALIELRKRISIDSVKVKMK